MAMILENQHVSKRRRLSSRTGSNYKSAGLYSGIIDQIHQKPTHKKREKRINCGSAAHAAPSARDQFRFKIPMPSLATIAVIVITIAVAFIALNWQNINIDIPDIYSFAPVNDSEAGEMIIQYGSTGVPGLSIEKSETEKNTAAETAQPEQRAQQEQRAAAKPAEVIENHHGIPVPFEWRLHTVKKGEVISRIAEQYKVSVGAIIASNDIKNARRVPEGAVLKIPSVDGIPHKVKSGDSLLKISASYNVPLEVILDINDIISEVIKPGETIFIPGARMNDIDLRMSLGDLFSFPLQTRVITSYYGMRKDPFNGALQFHDGVDFSARTGTTVMASLDGTVSAVGESWLYGKYIILTHGNGYKTMYGHLSAFSVKQGDRVARGRKIGEVGNTGYSTGPHLHFGMYDKNNKLVNPLDLLN